ncbi:fungal-specific transcription factor domain-containing protein [Mycena sanguinolenta]|nr:fungal-specific transcription factor domain-containing protein [Mycena sanguinolenta]
MEASPSQSSSSSSAHPNGRKSQITSCAECRRLKLRCDRIFPCSSCIRRGCANLCPTGTLEKGKRGFLKRLEQSLPTYPKAGGDAEHSEVAMFVARDNAMTKRIQELEAALVAAGLSIPGPSGINAEPSQENEGRTKRQRTSPASDTLPGSPSTPERDSPSSVITPVDTTDVTLGFGTLTIDVENRSRYIGPSGGAPYLNADLWKINASQTPSSSQDHAAHSHQDQSNMGISILHSSALHYIYLLSAADSGASSRRPSQLEAEIMAKIVCLPSYDEAVRIAGLYFKNGSFMQVFALVPYLPAERVHRYEIIPEHIFFSVHLPAIYPDAVNPYVPANLHVLALGAIVLSLGMFFDLSLPVESVRGRASEFYDLAAAALNISIPLKTDTIPAVQTLHLMTLYFLSTSGEKGGDPAWQLLGMAMRSIQAQGCHRDGSRWGLPQRELEERRRVFWETHMYDRLNCTLELILGHSNRSPLVAHTLKETVIMPQSCDTPLPSDTDVTDSTWSHMRWHTHKFRFAILLGRIVDLVFSVTHPTYSVIMELDREINQHYKDLPAWIMCDAVQNPVKELPTHALGAESDMRKNAQIASLANMYFLTLLHLHRGPFCRALMMDAKNLVGSRYAASIAARAMINIARGLFALHPAIASRMWYWLFHVESSAVCLSVLTIVAPCHPLSSAAFESLQAALELFQRADGDRAKSAAIRVGWLTAKASRSMEAYRNAKMHQPPADTKLEFPTSNIRGNPEDLLGMSTKLVRAAPGDSHGLQSNLHPMSGSDAAGSQFEDGRHNTGYSRPGRHEHWPSAPPPAPQAGGNAMNWNHEYGYSSMPLGGNPHSEPHFHQADPSGYLSVDGFDLSGFIQHGANAWLFDRAPEPESEASLLSILFLLKCDLNIGTTCIKF